jgi:chromosome segregation ATPase
MKFVAILLIALVATSFAKKNVELLQEAHDSKIGAAMKAFVQMHDETTDDINEVADILGEVHHEIETLLNNIQDQYEDAAETAEETAAGYQSDIDSLSASISGFQSQLDVSRVEASDLQAAIDNALSAISQAQNSIDDEVARRTDSHTAFSSAASGLQGAIDAAQDALRLLQEIDDQDLAGSFLEINQKKINKHFSNIHETLSNLNVQSSVITMTKMLVEIASQGINHDLIAQIEDLINHLIDTLNDELDTAVQADNEDAAYSANAIATLQDTVDTETASANDDQAKLDSTNADIENFSTAIDNLSATLALNQDALAAFSENWKASAANYDSLIRRLQGDLQALEAAQQFIGA